MYHRAPWLRGQIGMLGMSPRSFSDYFGDKGARWHAFMLGRCTRGVTAVPVPRVTDSVVASNGQS